MPRLRTWLGAGPRSPSLPSRHLLYTCVAQAEVRVVLVRTPPLAAGSSLTEVARLQPRVPCRSSLVHVAWAGAGASGRTLVVAWGRDLELLSWPAPSAAPGEHNVCATFLSRHLEAPF